MSTDSALHLERPAQLIARQWPLPTRAWTGRAGRLAIGLAVWTLLGVLDGAESYYKYIGTARPMSWSWAIASGLCLWYTWMLLGLSIFAVTRRYPLVGPGWPRRAMIYLAAGVACVLFKLLLDWPVISIFFCSDPGLSPFGSYYTFGLRSHGFRYYLTFCGLVAAGHALTYSGQLCDRERRTAVLKNRLASAQLQLLQLQLSPHFLCNTLNAISVLIHRDVEVADRMVARLGSLLRLLLDRFDAEEVTLAEELEFMGKYLEIEQERYGARLRVRHQIESGLLRACVPPLVLQPLVENSLKHGIGRDGRDGVITLRARKKRGRLRLEVEDDGVGVDPRHRRGVGLSNTHARLQQLYPGESRFELRPGESGGTLAILELPFHTHADGGRRPVAVD
jgi:two-component system LytT family sensor kinase